MMRPSPPNRRWPHWRSFAALACAVLVGLAALTAFGPAEVIAPIRALASDHSPVARPQAQAAAGTGERVAQEPPPPPPGPAPTSPAAPPAPQAPVAPAAPAASTADPEPGVALISAAYNAIQDKFFKELDSRDLLEAAWEGARRALAEQRHLPSGIDEPRLTGDRAGDLQAFLTQYRALVGAAGPSVDANRVAMVSTDLMTQSVGEQHTVFLPPEAFARFRASLTSDSGRVGLGVLIQGQTAPFIISSVIAGAPAEKAGVKEGDVIVAVDGRSVERLELRDVSEALRGDEGQAVTLTVRRSTQRAAAAPAPAQAPVQPAAGTSTDETLDVRIVRARFTEPPLTMRVLPEGVCVFRLSNFPVAFIVGPTGRTIAEDWDYYLEQCEQAGGKGWVVDLRGNGGGASFTQVLGRFVDAGPVLLETDKLGSRYEQASDGHLFRVQRPLVVLIDGNSASASEAFASAVQEHKRGIVMGRRSAGALNTGNIMPLPLGAGMMVAVREVRSGLKEAVIDEVGVEPDVTLNLGRDASIVPQEAIDAALNPPAGVGPLPAGPNTYEGMLSAAELKRRSEPVLLQPSDARLPKDQIIRGELAFDTIHYYISDYPSLVAARARALRLGFRGVYARWIGEGFPPPFSVTISYYATADGAHQDLREVYQEGEPRNPPQWKEVPSPISLGEETMAQVGTGQNEGRIWISWRRGGTVYTVAQNVPPGDPQTFDEIARLAQIVDQRAQANPS